LSGFAVMGAVMFANIAVVSAAAGPAVDLDQCRNGGLVTSGTQTFVQCAGNGSGASGWVNGNAGASNAHYAEGESISYRARLTGLKSNDAVTLIMGYDVVHGGVHAIDYLTREDRWQSPETTAAAKPDLPCSNVTGCSDPTDLKTADIPAPIKNVKVDTTKTLANGCEVAGSGATQQPVTSFGSIAAADRVMEFFDATPAASNAIQYVGTDPNLLDRNGDQEQQISVTFTANSASPVLSWGGHIASRLDWGCSGAPQSASGISGSPYHMRIKSIIVNGTAISLGNQDRSLSAAAVIFVAPGISTTPSPASGNIGVVLNDSATLSGALSPTGSITFKLFPPSDASCAGTPVYTQAVALNGATTVSTSPGYTSLVAGTYRWTATYPGDGQNAAASSGCTEEQVAIAKASPTLGTTPSPSSGSIGTLLNDSATLTGASSPTGNIDFKLFPPSDGLCAGTPVYTDTAALSGNSAATSPGYTSLVAGTYRWTADYAGDANNNSASSGCQAEQVAIAKASPTLGTTPSPSSGSIGATLNDSATLTGASSPTGNIDFKLFPPSDGLCAGTPVFSQSVALTGSSAATTGGYVSLVAGTYRWTADYAGDANNNSASSGCQAEQVTIGKNSPTAATAQNLIPNDTFTLGGGASATGSVTFYLFDPNGTCNAAGTGAVYSQTVTLSGGTTAATTNTGSGAGMYKASLEGTYTWYASYGGDSNNNAAVSDCVETFSIHN
jgi:uncharacterized protein (DUF2141 family)